MRREPTSRRPPRGGRARRATARLAPAAALLAALAGAGCDDLVKWVPIFSTMTEQPSVETYEERPREPVEGTMPVEGEHVYAVAEGTGVEETLTLQEADTLTPPTDRRPDLRVGQMRFLQFCAPCHGAGGQGDGPVVGPNRIPPVPMLDLRSENARGFSDGYVWGMITVGRGLMPSYRRIPAPQRWDVVAYVRALQSGEAGPEAGGATGGEAPAGDTAAGAGAPARETGADTTGADTTGGGR